MRRVIIVGRAASVLDEYKKAIATCEFDDIIVVGEMAIHFPYRVDHWVSWHAELFPHWERKRTAAGFSTPGAYWSASFKGRKMGEHTEMYDRLQHVKCVGGSSGMLAVQVALDGLVPSADRVVLTGVPMLADAAHYGVAEPWPEANKYWQAWLDYSPTMGGRVRSVSGRTRDLLGAPTPEWLAGG